ncbi:MAG: hypothetical protein QOF76_4819 [Solirubrobacteraceae bacterium]|jgi:pimeloyl-ACP methyl ester carboxylesterase|nr:hypothetical protein [Solirubrobacteraceae bacterium]
MATEFTRAGLTFDVTESGPPDGETVLLLHGFPQHRSSWDALVPILNDAGYRTIAFDQRGYSPRARPKRRFDYRMPELVADAKAAIDQLAGGRAHVVGHDWGSAVAWSIAAQEPASVASLTAVSVPHPFAFLRSMVTTRQGVRSWYMYLFQLPWLPELLLRTQWKRSLVDYGRQTPALAERDRAAFTGPGALTGPLNWYRAMLFVDPRRMADKVSVPALLVWSDGDVFIDRRSVDRCAQYVTGPYRLEVLRGATHWIGDQAPEQLAQCLVPHLIEHTMTTTEPVRIA